MRIYSFDAEHGHTITAFESRGVRLTPILRPSPALSVACFTIEPGGVIGHHQAVETQLLLVLAGDASVSGADGVPVVVGPGDAVLWDAAEWHETRTNTGLTALVMEGTGLDEPPGFRLQLRDQPGSS